MQTNRLFPSFLLCWGCAVVQDERKVEAIELPTDPSQWGVPVGVKTIEHEGQRLEVWYPAVGDASPTNAETVSFSSFLPAQFLDHLGHSVQLPEPPTNAVRNAPLRRPPEPVPVLMFSHGFGGMRVQSFGLTSHLASRGYVVVAPDHPGRMLSDVLPCLFSPTLDGCDLSGFGNDPAIDDLNAALDWVEDAATQDQWRDLIDLDRVGLLGHSAGGNSTTTLGDDEDRFKALAPMAGGGVVRRDVPVLRVDASCDGFVPSAQEDVLDSMTDGRFVQIHGGGHLAFTNLCELELGVLADEIIGPRDDANTALLPQLRKLAVDGCPGEPPLVVAPECEEDFLSLDVSNEIVRFHLTQFFDQQLRGQPTAEIENPYVQASMWLK